jgi:hypothetical protein
MKNVILYLFWATQLFNFNSLNAQCHTLQSGQSNRMTTFKSTGVEALDEWIAIEKKLVEDFFKVKTDLHILDDSDSPNAFATEESSNTFRLDGTVYLGYKLLGSELSKKEGFSTVRGILAHEYAHILQLKLDCKLEGDMRELHADFMAGWYVGIRSLYKDKAGVIAFAKSLYAKGDVELWDEAHHGTPKQRLKAMLGGYAVSAKTTDPKIAYYAGVKIFSETEIQEEPQEEKSEKVTIKSDGIVYDQIFAIEFRDNNIDYSGLLIMKDGVGKMRLRYGNKIVEQKMSWLTLTTGGVYQGYNPIDVSTGKRAEYRADNFYIIDGKCWNMDDAGNKAKVTSVELTSVDKANEWLKYLNW